MDRATLNAKSTISHCPPSLITRKRASVDSKLSWDREMSVIGTYLNDNAQTPVGRFVVYALYNELCNKYCYKSNWWSLCLIVYGSYSVHRRRWDKQPGGPSSSLLIPASSVRWRKFFKSTVAQKKWKERLCPLRGSAPYSESLWSYYRDRPRLRFMMPMPRRYVQTWRHTQNRK